MTYGVIPYLVGWDNLKSVFGSENHTLAQEMIDHKSDKIDQLRDLFDDKDSCDPVLYLQDFIIGEINHKNGALYAYVLELLCDYLGRLVNNSEWYPVDNWYGISPYLPNDLPFSFPNPDDFPHYKVISPQNVDGVKETIEASQALFEAQRNQFLHWLNRARETNRALALFYY